MSQNPRFIKHFEINSVGDEDRFIKRPRRQRKSTYPTDILLQVQLISSFSPPVIRSIDKMFSPFPPS